MQVIKEYSGIKVTVNEEDLNKKGVIYLLEFPNGKVYIGQTTRTLRQRLIQHLSTSSNCRKIKNAIEKYKSVTAYVLSSNLTIDQLNVYEQFFIKSYDSINYGYNLAQGGLNHTHSEETRKILSDKRRLRETKQSTKEKISKGLTGRSVSNETRAKLGKKIRSLPDDKIFNSVREAGKYYNIASNHIANRYLNGKVHGPSGQTFVLLTDESSSAK